MSVPKVLEPYMTGQTVVWRYVHVDGKKTKPPFQPDHPTKQAKVNDSSTWGSPAAAKRAVRAGKAEGIGVALQGNKLGGIDVDNCFDEDGEPKAWAKPLF